MATNLHLHFYYFISEIGGVSSTSGGNAEGYSVRIITEPRQDPFRVDQAVTFSCVVEPVPPDSVTYQWRNVEYSVDTGETLTVAKISA